MPTFWGREQNEKSRYPLSPLTREHQERADAFWMYWKYYRGRHRRNLAIKAGQSDDNVTLNYCRRTVDKGISFLFGGGVEFELNADERTPEEEYLETVWGTQEQKGKTLIDIATNGAVCGTPFVRLYQAVSPGDLPRIAVIDPMTMDIVTSPDDMDEIISYRMTWKSGDAWKRQRIDRQSSGTWVITTEEWSKANVWQLIGEEFWPYQFAPMFFCQNLPDPTALWGVSDLEEADINDAINFTASNINRILRFHSHPKTIGTGFSASQLENTAIDQFWSITDPLAKVSNLEMQSDLGSAYQFLQALKQTLSRVTGVPDLDPSESNFGQLSGFAMRILYADLLEKTNVKRMTYGAMLSAINGALLEMGGMVAGSQVRNVWADPLPKNEIEESAALDVDRRNGLSEETYLERRGYDAERELERTKEERDAQQTIGEKMLAGFERGGIAQTVSRNAAPGT